MKPFEIFKPGKHTSAGGSTLDFSEDTLRQAVSAYDPALHEAPIVVGHPKDNHPAFGWIKSLEFSDGKLLANPGEVNPDFAEIVASGAYKKRSASWYLPDSPSNPKPGSLYLRHVGFLGAQPPAIKGLRDVSFSEAEEGVVEFADTGFVASLLASTMRRMREWIISDKGIDAADAVVPAYVVTELEAESRKPAHVIEQPIPQAVMPASFNESEETGMTPEEIAAMKAENERLKAEQQQAVDFAEKQADMVKREAAIARKEIGLEIDGLIAAGKVLPVQKPGLVEFMASLGETDQVVEFGEGDSAKKLSPREFMRGYLASMPKLVDFGEHSKDAGASNADDLTGVELAQKITEYQEAMSAKGISVSATEAVAAVKAGKTA